MKKRDNENYTVLVDVAESDGKKSKKAAKKQKENKKKSVELDEMPVVQEGTAGQGKKKKRRRRLGDRSDGRLLRTLAPAARISPYIMHIRSDSQNHFEEEIDITEI